MFVTPDGAKAEISRLDALTHAIEALKKRLPARMVNTWIGIRRGTQSWRERAAELGITPSAIGYHLRRVDYEIDRLFRDDSSA